MSATVPESMLLSDLLKSTGYDCPESLQGKTFDDATSGGTPHKCHLYAWQAGGSIIYTMIASPKVDTHIYGIVSRDGISTFEDTTSETNHIVEVVSDTLIRVGTDSSTWAPYERNASRDVTSTDVFMTMISLSI